ncbi:Copia protein [Dufourea novaeangliae]|uniref:Copia protein n=1 Tax=Dufourea novaeangliae TaxID=178035 RepID=A0A154PR54_DUFNO|nr:Copia protein [Dufourea novaeangliae]
MNRNVYKFVREKGIQINACPPYVHELNGTAERFNRTIMDMSRCVLDEARVHRRFWPEVVCAAAYLKNRVLANTVDKKTPYEIFFDKKPSVKHLRLYGSRVFVRVPEQKRESKWDKKARLGILLGYTEVGYRVLLDNKIRYGITKNRPHVPVNNRDPGTHMSKGHGGVWHTLQRSVVRRRERASTIREGRLETQNASGGP